MSNPKDLLSFFPDRLPESLPELTVLLQAAIEAGYRLAVEHAVAAEDDGHITNHPYIDWAAADQRLADVLAATKP